MLVIPHISARAEEYAERPYLYKARATAYILKGKTASGTNVRNGICASGREEWFGKTIILYSRYGNDVIDYIGTYECVDCGCKPEVIDVWCSDMDEAQEFMNKVYARNCGGKVWVQVIDADG